MKRNTGKDSQKRKDKETRKEQEKGKSKETHENGHGT